ncbi:hypothetical protein EIP91_011220 [Steccherinum ochraceum]|uniref:Uncharacterized protein n=1 Tax=Steccherinum ochraceum TaxID=92696 RepID=A0A4R0RYM1_9APHY|nr:hypothetical protein EIP91_011220 [Steccherinum ochraceum]
MNLNISLPLLGALGIRILINILNPDHTSSSSDHLLIGLWQGILFYYSLVTLPDLAIVVGFGIGAKFLFDLSRQYEDTASRSVATLIGVAIGVLVTNVLNQFLEDAGFTGQVKTKERDRERPASHPTPPPARELHAHEPSSRRLRLVSFGRSNPDRHRPSRHGREHESRSRRPDHDLSHHDLALRDVVSPAPTNAYSIDTQPSISIESCPSSIDPHGTMSPAERQVALLRARASLADSERRRFKEERKWALSQGNKARANQLAWQVKRFTALMESYHREADAKVVEAARAAAAETSIPFPSTSKARASTASATAPAHSSSSRRAVSQPVASGSQAHSQVTPQRQTHQTYAGSSPLVSVTVGGTAAASGSRTRKRSGGGAATGASGSGLRPAIYVQQGGGREFLTSKR